MNTVCDFLPFEMDSSSLGSSGGRLIEVSTGEVYQGCPWEGSGFGREREAQLWWSVKRSGKSGPVDSSTDGWPFRTVLSWDKRAGYFYPCISQECSVTLGEVTLHPAGASPELLTTEARPPSCSHSRGEKSFVPYFFWRGKGGVAGERNRFYCPSQCYTKS